VVVTPILLPGPHDLLQSILHDNWDIFAGGGPCPVALRLLHSRRRNLLRRGGVACGPGLVRGGAVHVGDGRQGATAGSTELVQRSILDRHARCRGMRATTPGIGATNGDAVVARSMHVNERRRHRVGGRGAGRGSVRACRVGARRRSVRLGTARRPSWSMCMQAATSAELTGTTSAVATYACVAVCDSRFVVTGRTGPCVHEPAGTAG